MGLKKFCNFPCDSEIFAKFSGILRFGFENFGILSDFLGIFRIIWNFFEIFRDFYGFFEISADLYGIWDFLYFAKRTKILKIFLVIYPSANANKQTNKQTSKQ